MRFRGVAIGKVREIAIAAAVYPEALRGGIPRSEAARLNEVDLPGLVERIALLVDAVTESVTVGEGYRRLVEGWDLLASLRRQSEGIGPRLEAAATEAERTARGLREIAESRELRGILANTAAASAKLRNALARLPATLAATEQTIRRVEALVGEADRDLGPGRPSPCRRQPPRPHRAGPALSESDPVRQAPAGSGSPPPGKHARKRRTLLAGRACRLRLRQPAVQALSRKAALRS